MRATLWVNMCVMGLVLCSIASSARAQFSTPASTDVRQRVAGKLITESGGPVPQPGDQLGAFADDELVGSFTFISGSSATEFAFVIFGDSETTSEVDGAKQGVKIEFRFFDASSNVTYLGLGIKSESGETFNYTFAGQMVPPFDLPGFPIDQLVPTQALDMVVTNDPTNSGGLSSANNNGSGDGSGTPEGDFDIDGDGKVTTRDAAMVLRILSGSASVTAAEIQRADVNGDQVVNTEDAIAVLRNR